MPAFLWMTNAQPENTFCNRAYLEFRGRTQDEELGRGWLDGVHPDDVTAVKEAGATAYPLREPFEYEARFLDHSGEYRWLLGRGAPCRDASGTFTGYIGTSIDITHRKEADGERDRVLALLSAIDNASPIAAAYVDSDLHLRQANRTFRELVRQAGPNASGSSMRETFGPLWGEQAERLVGRVLRTGEATSNVSVRLQQQGSPREYRHLLANFYPVTGADGSVSGVGLSLQDVTDLKASEETAQLSEARYRTLTDTLPEMIWSATPEGQITFLNEQWLEFTGHTAEEGLGSGWTGILHPDEAEEVTASWARSMRTGEPFEMEERLRRSDGVYRSHIVRAVPVRAADGEILEWSGSCTDIHDVRYAQARYHTLTDALPELIWSADADGAVNFVNQRAADYTGRPQKELSVLGLTPCVHVDDLAETWERYIQAIKTGTPYEVEHRIRRHDGEYRWHMSRGVPLRDTAGVVLGWFGSATDIHDLRLEQLRNRTFNDAVPQLLFTLGANGKLEHANQRSCSYTGSTVEELLRTNWQPLIHPDDLPRTRERFATARESITAFEAEHRILRHDGEYRWHITRAVPLVDDSGQIAAWFGSATDVDEDKRAEARIAELNHELQLRVADLETLLRVMPIGVGVAHNPDCRDIRMNPAMADMLLMPPDGNASLEVMGAAPYRIEKDGQALGPGQMVMHRAARGEGNDGTITDEFRVVRHDGSHLDLLAFAAPITEDGHIRGAIGAFVDVTELKRAREALLAEQARYVAAGDAVPFGVWASAAEGDLTYVSDSFLQMLGMTLEEARKLGWINGLVRERRAETAAAWRECVARRGDWDREHDFLGADGTWHTVLTRGRPVTDADGKFYGYAGINLDITEMKQMQSDLASTVEELRQANAVKDELLGLVSHELRTPLTTISGNAQALRRHAERIDAESRDTALQDIEDDAARLQRLIENMLVLSRAEAEGDFETEPVLLQRLLPRIAIDLHRRAFRANVQMDVPDDLPAASAQPVYVEQILGNLVSNAVKYSEPGGSIDIRAWQEGDHIAVVVEDRGAGITEEEAIQVFTPFFRAKRTAGQAGGIGLGLAVCKRLVEVQGGRVWAAPRDGGGATVGFTLPIAKVQLTD